jgi:hypothetical protein
MAGPEDQSGEVGAAPALASVISLSAIAVA